MDLYKNQVRSIDRIFERMMTLTGHTSPLAMVDHMFNRLESHTEGEEVTLWKMVPTRYRVEKDKEGRLILEPVVDSTTNNADTSII